MFYGVGTRLGLVIFLVACSGPGRAPASAAAPTPSNPAAPARGSAVPAPAPAGTPAEATGSGSNATDTAQGDASGEEDETQILGLEAIGPLRFDSSGPELVKHLGAPRAKSPPILEGATGAYYSSWSWPGVAAGMAADKPPGPWKARSITVSAPSKLATKAGIRIGSSRKEVEAKYRRGSMDQGAPETLLVGSPYGGMYFTFKNGVVTEIAIGVFAF